MRNLLIGLASSIFVLFSAATTAQIVVTPGDAQGWIGRASNTGTLGLGPADQQGGTGSLSMITTGGGGDIVKVARVPLITIDAITSISWDVYTDNAASYPRPQLEYYQLGGRAGTLTYVASNTVVPVNAWTSLTVDNNDLFQSSEAGASPPQTLAEWQLELSGVLMNFFQLGYGSTTGSTTTNANIDFVELNGTTWNFEAVPPVEPPPPAESVTVDPTMLNGWFEKGVNPGVIPGSLALSATSPPGNPLAPGALELTLDGVDDQIVNAARIPVTLLTDISEISWSASSTSTELPVAKVEYFGVLSGRSGTLIPIQPTYPGDGSWVTLDGLTLQWATTEAGFPGSQTFAEWQQELGPILVNFFSVGIGSSGGTAPAATAYVDQVVLGTARSITTWDFEGAAPLPPEPALTTTTITSSAPNPSDIGEAVTVSYQVAVVAPDTGAPTGTVTVSDGVTRAILCSGTAAAGSCSIPGGFAVAGSVGLEAAFVSDDEGFADSISGTFVHTVEDSTAGPTPPPGGAPATPVPTLSEWMLALLALFMVTVVVVRRKQMV